MDEATGGRERSINPFDPCKTTPLLVIRSMQDQPYSAGPFSCLEVRTENLPIAFLIKAILK
jgi:hypothetical protein